MSEAHSSCNRCTSGMRNKDLMHNTAGVCRCDVHQDFFFWKKKLHWVFYLSHNTHLGKLSVVTEQEEKRERRSEHESSILKDWIPKERGAIKNSLSYVHLWNSCICWWVLESMFVDDKWRLVMLWQVILTHQHEFGHVFSFFWMFFIKHRLMFLKPTHHLVQPKTTPAIT